MKGKWITIFFVLLLPILLPGCGGANRNANEKTITVFNAGEYIDPETLKIFEKETGITVIYEEFDTNEIMYTKAGLENATYDVLCPSDYMIERLIREDRLIPLDYKRLPNLQHLSKNILGAATKFDPDNTYAVPYCYGTVGILYNTKYVRPEEVRSWDVLWDKKYTDQVLMPDSVRDIMAVALKRDGQSLNTDDDAALHRAERSLIEQKPIVQAYVNDQVRDKMISEEAVLGVIYSGEALYARGYNENLAYSVPDEGSNLWIDAWVIPKTCHRTAEAYQFIDFMCRPDIAKMNYEYLTYSTPNLTAIKMTEDEDLRTDEAVIVPEEVIARCETMHYLPYELNRRYNDIFMRVKCH